MTTNTIIRKSTLSATGYELVFDGKVVLIDKTYPGEATTLVLPENPSNRKYFSSKKVDAAGGEMELEYKESRTLGPRSESTPRKALEDYLEGEDKELYLELVEKAKKAREEAHKKAPLTEEEKLLRVIARETAKLEALRAKKGEEA